MHRQPGDTGVGTPGPLAVPVGVAGGLGALRTHGGDGGQAAEDLLDVGADVGPVRREGEPRRR